MKRHTKQIAVILGIILTAGSLSACSSGNELSVEEEVAQILTESIPADGERDSEDNMDSASDTLNGRISASKEGGARTGDLEPKNNDHPVAEYDTKEADTGAVSINPFLGSTSQATSFYMSFNIETDSGVAGITWGSMDGVKGEYYLFAFDCTRDIPMLYTSRRQGGDVYDEEYTNLDFMYPKMDMFTSVEHIVEIVVSRTTATTYLDKYKVCDTVLNSAKPVGQVGTWVQKGDYHEYIDNLFVAEDVDGEGEWIYSDDFSRRNNLFSPSLKTESGRLYATSGYYVAPLKEDEDTQD